MRSTNVARRRVDVGEKVWTRVGTPAFWAPEVRFLVELPMVVSRDTSLVFQKRHDVRSF